MMSAVEIVIDQPEFVIQAFDRYFASYLVDDVADFMGLYTGILQGRQVVGDVYSGWLSCPSVDGDTAHVTWPLARPRFSSTNCITRSRLCDFVQCFTR